MYTYRLSLPKQKLIAMPNHIQNRIQIIGSTEDIAELITHFTTSEGVIIDFEKILPPPPYIFKGDVGRAEEETYGQFTGLDWNRKNWGTKWNAYGQPDMRNTSDTIYFETAWSGVPRLMGMLSILFPKIEVKYDYADEDSGYNVGQYVFFKGGNVKSKNIPDGGSIAAYDIYFELHPDSKEDFELVDGKYQYKEEDEV